MIRHFLRNLTKAVWERNQGQDSATGIEVGPMKPKRGHELRIGMNSDKWAALRQEKVGLTEIISELVVEINEHTRLIEMLSKKLPTLYIQLQIDKERLITARLSQQFSNLVRRLAVVELLLAISDN